MNRLTTMGPDGRPQMTAGVGLPEMIKRLYQFEEALDGVTMEQLRSLCNRCRDWAGSGLADDKEDYTDGIN